MVKKHWLLPLRFFLLLLLLVLLSSLFSFLSINLKKESSPTLSAPALGFEQVVLDAGHGGEDGGAVSPQGYFEKDINLSLCKQMQILLESNGIPVVMTRTEDILLYDRNADYHGRKKALDLAARKKIAEDCENSLFVSIHMNAYPLPQYKGLQVWYSPNHVLSQSIAQQIQSTVESELQPQNDRKIKPAGSNIYLLHHLQSPAVLVECGFLSNPEEAEALHSEEYQKQLAFLIALSLLQGENLAQK